jgi:hypothetical protein
LSYARDFYCGATSSGRATTESTLRIASTADDFSNVDGVYASKNVKRGCVVLTESQLPDCSLPRSANANCLISQASIDEFVMHLTLLVLQLPSGEMCLLAADNIRAGDWLTVAPSSDSDSDN